MSSVLKRTLRRSEEALLWMELYNAAHLVMLASDEKALHKAKMQLGVAMTKLRAKRGQ